MAEASNQGFLPFDESLSFLDELMNLEGINTTSTLPQASCDFDEIAGDLSSNQLAAASAGHSPAAAFPQPEGSFSSFPEPKDLELPDMPIGPSLAPLDNQSQKERARATQKRFRSRQKVNFWQTYPWVMQIYCEC